MSYRLLLVTTLAGIADSFGVEPATLVAMVGMDDIAVDRPLTREQVAFILDAADNNPFTGPIRHGRHRRTP